jgi:hypothetical protein
MEPILNGHNFHRSSALLFGMMLLQDQTYLECQFLAILPFKLINLTSIHSQLSKQLTCVLPLANESTGYTFLSYCNLQLLKQQLYFSQKLCSLSIDIYIYIKFSSSLQLNCDHTNSVGN